MTLTEYLTAARDKPFCWGEHDCARFAAGWVEAVTGRNPMVGWRYTTQVGAARALARRGFATLADAVAAELPEIPLAYAMEGDIAMVDGACGIVGGEVVYVLRSEGLGIVPMARAKRAFACRV